MAKLIYSMTMSLDGYIENADGNFDWAAPDEQVHAFVNDTVRSVGTFLFGRRMYEVMQVWDRPEEFATDSAAMMDFAQVWSAADKIVYSSTLAAPITARTTVQQVFDPEQVRQLKVTSQRDLGIGGPELAAHALGAGLVDECHLFVVPVVVGGGRAALPEMRLDLLEERGFDNGTVFLRYRPVVAQ